MRLRLFASAALCAVLAHCAGPVSQIPGVAKDAVAAEKKLQLTFELRSRLQQSARLNSVAYRIAVANRADCKANVIPTLGAAAATAKELPAAFRAIAVESLGFDRDRPTIYAVAEQGPAARAGLRSGDVLRAVDGEALPGSKPSAWLRSYLKRHGAEPVRITVVRDGADKTVTAAPIIACAIPVMLASKAEPNAYTDGKRIVVHRGLLRLAQTDSELAIVIGHELAHVAMGHIQKQLQNRFAGNVGGLVLDSGLAALGVNTGGAFTRAMGKAGARAYAVDFEKEADYVGTYYAARAGYDVRGAERFWRALAEEDPKQVLYAGLHPATPERFILMQKTEAEIADKMRKGLPLVPELKKVSSPPPRSDAVTY